MQHPRWASLAVLYPGIFLGLSLTRSKARPADLPPTVSPEARSTRATGQEPLGAFASSACAPGPTAADRRRLCGLSSLPARTCADRWHSAFLVSKLQNNSSFETEKEWMMA